MFGCGRDLCSALMAKRTLSDILLLDLDFEAWLLEARTRYQITWPHWDGKPLPGTLRDALKKAWWEAAIQSRDEKLVRHFGGGFFSERATVAHLMAAIDGRADQPRLSDMVGHSANFYVHALWTPEGGAPREHSIRADELLNDRLSNADLRAATFQLRYAPLTHEAARELVAEPMDLDADALSDMVLSNDGDDDDDNEFRPLSEVVVSVSPFSALPEGPVFEQLLRQSNLDVATDFAMVKPFSDTYCPSQSAARVCGKHVFLYLSYFEPVERLLELIKLHHYVLESVGYVLIHIELEDYHAAQVACLHLHRLAHRPTRQDETCISKRLVIMAGFLAGYGATIEAMDGVAMMKNMAKHTRTELEFKLPLRENEDYWAQRALWRNCTALRLAAASVEPASKRAKVV